MFPFYLPSIYPQETSAKHNQIVCFFCIHSMIDQINDMAWIGHSKHSFIITHVMMIIIIRKSTEMRTNTMDSLRTIHCMNVSSVLYARISSTETNVNALWIWMPNWMDWVSVFHATLDDLMDVHGAIGDKIRCGTWNGSLAVAVDASCG
eukprot:87346_1